VRGLKPQGKWKLVRATPAIIRCEAGQVFLPERTPRKENIIAECVRCTGRANRPRRVEVSKLWFPFFAGGRGLSHVPRLANLHDPFLFDAAAVLGNAAGDAADAAG
jgi:hypothetical protein